MKCYKLALVFGFIGLINPAISLAQKKFNPIEANTQIISEELLTELIKKGPEYKDSEWPKDVSSKKVDLSKVSDEVLQEAIDWMKTMVKNKWFPTDIEEEWLIAIRKEEYPAADYLIFRYEVDGYKIQVQENGIAVRILIEYPNSVDAEQEIEDFISSAIYEFFNFPKDNKDFLKFYLNSFEHNNNKIHFGTVDCAFDKKSKEAWKKRAWWNHTYIWSDGRRVFFSLVEYDGKPAKKPTRRHAKPGTKRRFQKSDPNEGN